MEPSDLSRKDEWKESEIQQLILLIDEFKTSCGSEKINSNELYMNVACKLLEKGFSKTFLQCKYKWKELISSYKEYKQSKTENLPQFYKEIDQVLNDISVTASTNKENTFGPPWSKYETNVLIKVMRVGDFVDKLKTDEPVSVYDKIAKYLQKFGPIQRSKEEIQQRWKNLKLSYIKYIKGEFLYFAYYDIMDDLLDWEPNTIAFEEDQFKDGHDYGDESYFNPEDYDGKTVSSNKRSMNWSHKEIKHLLDVIEKYNIKKLKREDVSSVFDQASIQLRSLGCKRSSDQCRIKFKQLKVLYFGTLRRAVDGEENPEQSFEFFDRMQDIMQNSNAFSDTDNDNAEHYEVEYLEEHDETENSPEQCMKDVSNSTSNIITSNTRRSKRKSRTIWSRVETRCLLNLLKRRDMTGYWRRPMFESISIQMYKAGYPRSAHMCMIKWKNLRNSLYSCVRNMTGGNTQLCPFYHDINEIVQKNHISLSRIADEGEEFEDDSAEEGTCEIAVELEEQCEPSLIPETSKRKYLSVEDSRNEESEPSEEQCEQYLVPEKLKRKSLHVENSRNEESEPLEEQCEQSLVPETLKRKSSCVEDSENEESEQLIKKFKNSETNLNKDCTIGTNKYTCNYKMDDAEHYCLSLATSFKRLSQKKQAALKIKFQKLLYEAEFDEYSD